MRVLIVILLGLALTRQMALAETVYVSNEQDNTVSVVDGGTLSLVGTIPVGRRPRGIGCFSAAAAELRPHTRRDESGAALGPSRQPARRGGVERR